jgi:hypothetical protein
VGLTALRNTINATCGQTTGPITLKSMARQACAVQTGNITGSVREYGTNNVPTFSVDLKENGTVVSSGFFTGSWCNLQPTSNF